MARLSSNVTERGSEGPSGASAGVGMSCDSERDIRWRADAVDSCSLESGRGLPCSFQAWMASVVTGGRGGILEWMKIGGGWNGGGPFAIF